MSAVPVAPQALQDPDAESIEPPSVDRELKSGANLTPGLHALSTWSRDGRDEVEQISPHRAFLACLARHALQSPADFFSILI